MLVLSIDDIDLETLRRGDCCLGGALGGAVKLLLYPLLPERSDSSSW